jgi:hypothetical protein
VVELGRKLWWRAERIAAQHSSAPVEERLRRGLILDALRTQQR